MGRSLGAPTGTNASGSEAPVVPAVWQTGGMRAFVPLLLTDLTAAKMPVRELLAVPTSTSHQHPDEVEELEYHLSLEASLASLELIRDAEPSPKSAMRRVVAAVELATAPTDGALEWEALAALLVDDEDATEDVAHICALEDQQAADEAVEQLLENHPLVWWDRAERARVAALTEV